MSEPPRIFRVGELLGETYEIRAVLGTGGMGQVFDAYDTALARRVAIKANFPETTFSVRTEAQALAAVHHPGVVGVYALGVHGGVDYMVMEHVSGVTLAQHLERLEGGGLPLAERLGILVAIGDGLAAIHRAGVSHGDVKPENVLLAASGRTVLTDLGLVRAAYEPDSGLVAGTPAYMAPEIISPSFGKAGWHLVDVYAFGVLCWRLLTGKLPYEAPSDLELLLMHTQSPVPRLADTTAAPKRLSELVEQLMAKDPHDRPEAMDAVVWQLRDIVDRIAREGALTTISPPPDVFRVLVVDDDADIAKLVGMYVKQAAPAAEILLAHDGVQALDIFRTKPPRLVFLDLNMPKMSGFELFTYLRGVHLVDASTIVAMSAGGSPTDVALMLELGAQDFIPKGSELRARVTKIVKALSGAS
ncbi:MAG TPA: serine/threonine-protein kinase [Labilithrix sp.]